MKSFFVFILLASSPSRESDANFQAANYETAISLYRQLVHDPSLQPWQQAIAQYNTAVSQINLNKWTEAEKTLLEIRTSSPYVLKHLYATLSYVHLHLDKPQDALYEINEAIKGDCLLQKVEGYPSCNPSQELVSLRESIEKSHPDIKTQFYIEIAKHWLDKASREHTEDPIITLKYAIQDQEFALAINRLKQDQSIIESAQKEVLNTADPFYPEVLNKEREEYPEACQCHPWDAVIPSFEEGYTRAKWQLPVISIQEDILRYWKQSLENVTKQETPKESSQFKETLREIQDMDEDDQSLIKEQMPTEQVEKPW